MAFPQTPLDIKADVLVDGVWSDVTADVLTRNLITIVRGRPDEGARSDPGKTTLTFNNGRSKVNPAITGRYSTGNPNSDLFGKIGRNTQVRVHVPAAEAHLELDGQPSGYVATPHHASLNITGDIDVRVEFDADVTLTQLNQVLIGKWGDTAATRSWMLRIYNGLITFNWLDAAQTAGQAFRTVQAYGGQAVRFTLDVDNGAGGVTGQFYQADSLDGPWTVMGAALVGASTTSIQATTSDLRIGATDSTTSPPRAPFVGSATRFQVRSGIGGTLVADADFRSLADAATGFTDSTGRVWTVNGTAKVRKRADRFNGEISSWPPRWDVSQRDAWTPVDAAGVLRRYGQGGSVLQSSLRRRLPFFSPLAYWPLEEGAQATQAFSPIAGVQPLKLTRVTWASAGTLPSSGSLPVLAAGGGDLATLKGLVPAPRTATTGWNVTWLYRLDTAPTSLWTFMRILTTGTVREWYVQSRDTQSRIVALDDDGNTLISQTIGTGADLFGQWTACTLRTSQSGGTVTWTILWQDVGGDAGSFTDSFTGTAGNVASVASPPDGYASALDGLALGHIAVFSTTTTDAYLNAITAWQGEQAGERMMRLASEEQIPVGVRGIIAEQEAVGTQGLTAVLDLLEECADSDGGILMEHRARPALRYRGRGTLYNQAPALTLNYATGREVAPPLEPLDDDADVVNDVTVQRIDGSSGQAVLEEGALSVKAPPNGIGTGYATSVQLSLNSDAQAEPIAGWRLHLGTWDAPRYPVVHVDLAAAPHLIDAILDVDQGDLIRITNPPAWLPPGDINLIVQQYTESFDQYAWDIFFTCTPADPWSVAVVGDAVRGRVGVEPGASTLAEAATSSATQLLVHTPAISGQPPRPWITSAAYGSDFPFDLRLGGEVVRATANAPALADAFGRTVAGGWGSADSGQAWTVVGTAADYSVGSGYGVAAQPTVGVAHLTLATAPAADLDLYVDVGASALATGASLYTGPVVRAVDNNNCYQARIDLTTANAVVLTVRKRVAGVETQLGGTYTAPLTHIAGTFYRVRLQAAGSVLNAKIWLASDPEPGGWHIETTDTALTAAANIGTRSFRNTGNTNVSPGMRFDNLTVVTPQRMTVTRSVNGIVKAQAAGAPVALAYPSIVAL